MKSFITSGPDIARFTYDSSVAETSKYGRGSFRVATVRENI